MNYLIHESQIDAVNKKLTSISKKCAKLGNPFSYTNHGEVWKEINDVSYKFFDIEVEGIAKINGWEFCGVLEAHETGNIVRQAPNATAIPEYYQTCPLVCDHCKTNHYRKTTIVIYNEERNEFKQVGKSCLKQYTNGLDAEAVVKWLDGIAEFEAEEESYGGFSSWTHYYKTADVVEVASKCIAILGYVSSQNEESVPTKVMTLEMLFPDRIRMDGTDEQKLYDKLMTNGYEDMAVDAEAMIAWAKEQSGNDYVHNLSVLANDPYVTYKQFGILCSLPLAYNKAMGREAERKAKKAIESNSDYIAEIGEKVSFPIKNYHIVTSFSGQFGVTFLVQFTDEHDNLCSWYTANPKTEMADGSICTATCKAQKEYKGIKQTVLTRCKFN